MGQWLSLGDNSRRWFRIVALAALLAAVGQITLGGVVRVTDSGLGCPDWPLCHGQIFPPLEFHALTEYFHRVSAMALGLLVTVVTLMAWWFYREEDRITVPITIALVLVVAAALLGGITVIVELQWWIVLIHLAVAECLVACLVVTLVTGWDNLDHAVVRPNINDRHLGVDMLLATTVLMTFFLVLAASYMVGHGYGEVCNNWPLCQGSILPVGQAEAVHMSHRIMVLFLGVLMAISATLVWRRRSASPEIRWVVILCVCLYFFQTFVGAFIVWTDFTSSAKAFHLMMATLVWVSVVLLATLNFLPVPFVFSRVHGDIDNRLESGRFGT